MTATPGDLARHEQTVQNAVNIAIVEMLLRPEYSMEFIEECVEDAQEGTAPSIDPGIVAERMDTVLADLAKPFLAALPTEIRERYQEIRERYQRPGF